jgi:hypothetical protein
VGGLGATGDLILVTWEKSFAWEGKISSLENPDKEIETSVIAARIFFLIDNFIINYLLVKQSENVTYYPYA